MRSVTDTERGEEEGEGGGEEEDGFERAWRTGG